jgi:hypothetical protein
MEARSHKLVEQRIAELEPIIGQRIFKEFRAAKPPAVSPKMRK